MAKEDIIELKRQLTEKELAILSSELEKHKKSTIAAYLLLIFLGIFGIHLFYIGKIWWGAAYLLLNCIGWIIVLGDISMVLAGLLWIFLGILLIIDLFTLPNQMKEEYEKAERRIVKRLLSSPRST